MEADEGQVMSEIIHKKHTELNKRKRGTAGRGEQWGEV